MRFGVTDSIPRLRQGSDAVSPKTGYAKPLLGPDENMNELPLDLAAEITAAEKALDDLGARVRRLWECVRVRPVEWAQTQYEDSGFVWVIAIMGHRCLYFNEVEKGWGWGRFESWGTVTDYHWQQDEVQHSVNQVLFAIDNGNSAREQW